MTNDDVKKIAVAAEMHTLANGWPVTIVILDDDCLMGNLSF